MSALSPEAVKRLQNQAKLWTERMAGVDNDADLAKVCFDRAKAAARRAQKTGNTRAMHELAELLAHWSQGMEHDAAKAASRNAA